MNARIFFDKVAAMREAQKAYFKTRSTSALSMSKALEREIDAEIRRVQAIIDAQEAKQQELFKTSKNIGK